MSGLHCVSHSYTAISLVLPLPVADSATAVGHSRAGKIPQFDSQLHPGFFSGCRDL